MQKSALTCLSTFTGLGGLDLGLEAAGFGHLASVEWDECARRSIKANRGDQWNLLAEGDIQAVAASVVPADLGLKPGELDLLAGAPPCQPYSKAGQWVLGARQGMEDRRGRYLDDFMALLAAFQPRVALIENVRGFVSGRTSALAHITAALERCGTAVGSSYRIEHRVIDAADLGVPQHRARAIIVITRVNAPFNWPAPRTRSTAWDAIGGQKLADEPPDLRGKWAGLLPSIPEGKNYLWHTSRGGGKQIFGYRTRYWSFLLKLAKDAPSWTLSAQPGPATGPFHWDNRPLAVEEMLRLQSFPSDWIVEGSTRGEKVKQIGNATPPLLAEAVGLSIAAHIKGDDNVAAPKVFTIRRSRSVPGPRTPSDVPEVYLKMVGEYPDHPGHGMGPGAKAYLIYDR